MFARACVCASGAVRFAWRVVWGQFVRLLLAVGWLGIVAGCTAVVVGCDCHRRRPEWAWIWRRWGWFPCTRLRRSAIAHWLGLRHLARRLRRLSGRCRSCCRSGVLVCLDRTPDRWPTISRLCRFRTGSWSNGNSVRMKAFGQTRDGGICSNWRDDRRDESRDERRNEGRDDRS